jgi:hypothetical protein
MPEVTIATTPRAAASIILTPTSTPSHFLMRPIRVTLTILPTMTPIIKVVPLFLIAAA